MPATLEQEFKARFTLSGPTKLDVDVEKVLDFESALVSYMNAEHADFMQAANETGLYNDEVEDSMRKAIETFKNTQTW